MTAYDVIILGGGVESLVAAGYLGKAGRRVLVLEAGDRLGGSLVTTEAVDGFRFDGCADAGGYLSPHVVQHLALAHHGLNYTSGTPFIFAPRLDGARAGAGAGAPIRLNADPAATAAGLKAISPQDGDRWPGFCERIGRYTSLLEKIYMSPAPRPGVMEPGNIFTMVKLAARARGLGKAELLEFLRTAPMPVADLLDDWFEDEGLKGALGVPAVRHLCQGPRSAGTAFTFLHQHVGARGVPRGRPVITGGVGHLSWALEVAGRERGVEFRTGTPVAEVQVRDGRVGGVVLENGDDLSASVVVSGHDARRTFLDLIDPVQLDPDFVHTVQHLRYRGVAAKVNLALSELPQFTGMQGPADLVGTIVLCDDLVQLEQAYDAAKYGRVSDRLVAEVTVPSVTDPSLAPDGAHVMSVWLQYAPFHRRDGVWDKDSREALGDAAQALLAQYAPNIPGAVVGREIFTPLDMQAQFGLTEGNLYQGELGLDQVLFMRPIPGWSHYQTPIQGLYLCGQATHPAGGIMGQSGLLAARQILKQS